MLYEFSYYVYNIFPGHRKDYMRDPGAASHGLEQTFSATNDAEALTKVEDLVRGAFERMQERCVRTKCGCSTIALHVQLQGLQSVSLENISLQNVTTSVKNGKVVFKQERG